MKKLSILFAALLTFVAFGTAPAHATAIMASPGLLDIAQDGEITVTQPIYNSGATVTGGGTAIRACKNEVASASGVDEASPGPLVGVADCITLVTSQGVTTVPASGVNIFTTYSLQANGNYSDLYQTYPHVGYLVEAVGASTVYSWTATIDVRTLSGAPASSAAETAAPTPAPYRGPAPSAYSVAKPAPGAEVVISGKRMNLVSSCTVDGVQLTITNQSADSLTIEIPETMEAGLKDLVMTGSTGKLTVIGAFAVEEPKVNVGSMNGHIAVYAKGHKGKTLSWKIAGKWFSTTVQSDYQVFQRKTVGVGKNVKVDLYIDGEKQLSTSVTTK